MNSLRGPVPKEMEFFWLVFWTRLLKEKICKIAQERRFFPKVEKVGATCELCKSKICKFTQEGPPNKFLHFFWERVLDALLIGEDV